MPCLEDEGRAVAAGRASHGHVASRRHRSRPNSSRRSGSPPAYHSFDMSYPSSSQCGQSNESYMYWSTGLSGLKFS